MSANDDSPEPDSPPQDKTANLPSTTPPAAGPNAGQQPADELRVSSREEILYRLDQLPGLVATGILTPAKANSMKAIYQTLLANMESTTGSAATLPDEDVLAVLRSRPAMLKSLKPFLTPTQIDLIVQAAQHD